MRKLVLLLLLFASFFARADEVIDVNTRENYFLTSTDFRIAPKVNPVTGEYGEEEVDLVVAGAELLSVRRFYNSSAPYDPRYATWRYNPECFFVANFEWSGQEIFASIGEQDGSVCSFKRSRVNSFLFHFEVPKSFSHVPTEGHAHPLNTNIKYERLGDPKDKHRFEYRGTIADGSGRERSFISSMHRWTHPVHWRDKRGWRGPLSPPHEKLYRFHPPVWTPYHIPITEERLPNGNILTYTYTQWKDEEKNYPLPKLLASITAYNSDKSKKLGFVHFHYERAKHEEVKGIRVIGSDGRSAYVHHVGESPINLESAERPGKAALTYAYADRALTTLTKPKGMSLTTQYNAQGKVSAQNAPVGSQGEMCSIGRYEYLPNATICYDAENNKTVYHFDADKKITALETYQGKDLYRINRYAWDPVTGNLLCKKIEDAEGKIFQITEYKYDKNQNLILERVGDGKQWQEVHRTFSEDGFNLKLTETDRDNKLVCYSYLPGTNLLSSVITYEGKAIRARTFHTYDDCAICIKTIVDDGTTQDPQNLHGVTFRKITEIQPRYRFPCFGLPESIEEKTLDASGNEISLGKVEYSYATDGQILKESHYDAQGKFSHSIENSYDQERLISRTAPMGATTSYTYDANHNITSVSGPRADQLCEIAYDKADRPVKITHHQAKGSPLISHKIYNKLGQVVEEKDPCGNSTRYTYDSLGRIIAIDHPDGAVERKEYDVLDNVTKEVDCEGFATTKTYNAFGDVLSIRHPDSSEETFSYTTVGQLERHVDKNGAVTHYTYDIFDHPCRVETFSPSGALLKAIISTWSSFQKLSETEGDLTTTYIYDFAGRKIGERQGFEERVFGYDTLGRIAYTQSGTVREVKEYDLCDRVVETRIENSGSLQKLQRFNYDLAGNCTESINSQGVTETAYNTSGKPLSIKDPLGQVTHFGYVYDKTLTKTITYPQGIQEVITCDMRGREALRVKKNARGETIQKSETRYNYNGNPITLSFTIFAQSTPLKTITHTWEYGPGGRVERFLEAGEKETRYFYDVRGRLQTLLKPDGKKLNHIYDDLGRLIRFYSSDFDYHYTFDARNRVTAVVDALSGTITERFYDSLSNILQETLANGLTIKSSYDLQSRRKSCELPDTSKIAYEYKGFFLHSVTRGEHTHTYTERNLEGQVTEALSPAGEISITRDPLGRYTSLRAPHFSADYHSYDAAGNLLHYSFRDKRGAEQRHYTYDDLHQLTHETGHTYVYDSMYNRLKKDTHAYALNALSQVTHDGVTPYTYDPCGNLTSDGSKTYTYDSLDRLIAIEDGYERTEYTYDPFHRRLAKVYYYNGSKQKTLRYLWDGKDEIGEVDDYDRIQQLHILGEGLGAEIGAAILYELEGYTYVPIHDHRGCVVTLLYRNAPYECYRYSAFGEEETEDHLSPWRFSSKRVDEETDFVYFGRRYYDPTLGRFLTQDPQGFEDGPNLYAYVHNNPLTYFDLYGHFGIGQGLLYLGQMAFRGLEWFGANLLPVPYLRNFIESVGRWGSGGDFFGASNYRYPSEIIPVHGQGKTVPSNTTTQTNGMWTSRSQAIEQAEHISETHGGISVDLLYQGTEGLIMDLIGCGLSKLGIPNAYNKMSANYFQEKLRVDPDHRFTSYAHSRGGIQLMNTGRMLSPEQRKQIDVISFGSATMIPNGYFNSAVNNVCKLDMVCMTNPLAYCLGMMGCKFNVNFLEPRTGCPYKAHGFLEATYREEIRRRGDEFQDLHFHK